jgi:hypothetical protein
VLVYAADRNTSAGLDLAKEVVSLMRADGMFAPALEGYAGTHKIDRLAATFARFGMTLAESVKLKATAAHSCLAASQVMILISSRFPAG